jgi:hypothetical protein
MENVLHQYPHMTERTETIEAYIQSPWWERNFNTEINETKSDVKNHHDQTQAHTNGASTVIYTDGSGIKGKIGAVAYSPYPLFLTCIHSYTTPWCKIIVWENVG